MDIMKIEVLVEEIKGINKDIQSVERILKSEYYPDTVSISFKFEDTDDEFVNENISLYAEVYMTASRNQKEYLIGKLNTKKVALAKETQLD